MRLRPRQRLISLLVLALAGFLAGLAQASSLGVSPSGFIIHDLQPGRQYDLYKEAGVRFTINNGDATSHTFIVTPYRPSERGRWEKGYLEIPDPNWCRFEKNAVTVGPNSKGYAHLFLKIPAEEKYFNQRWIVTFGIESKPGAGGIALAIDVRAQIETQSKPDVLAKPDGPLGFAPSRVQFDGILAGTSRKSGLTIYNNDPTTHTYRLSPIFSDQSIRPVKYLTQGWQAIPDSRWLTLGQDKLTIGPHGTARLSLAISIPANPSFADKRWEEILLVQPDQGLPGLIRVHVSTKGQ